MILVIDNYDSFTWNLVQYLGELGAEPVVRRNDELSVEEVEALAPTALLLSPGPCTPAEAGISVECVRRLAGRVPMLGVCLGHQAIGAAFGARIVLARRPMHGKVSPVTHERSDLFRGLSSPMAATRYHSLVIDPDSVPAELEVLARTGEPGYEDEIQAIRHRRHAVWGVQFHPESVATPEGKTLLRNFLELAGGAR